MKVMIHIKAFAIIAIMISSTVLSRGSEKENRKMEKSKTPIEHNDYQEEDQAQILKPSHQQEDGYLLFNPVKFKHWLLPHPESMVHTTRSTGPVTSIYPGFTFDAILTNGILSFNTITPVIAETEFDILYLGQVIFPKKTKLIGTSNMVKTLNRVNIQFHTIAFPNGRWIQFTGMALHTDGSGGVPGKVKKEKAAIPARILLRTAGAVTAIGTGQPLAGELISGIAGETEKELQERQTYSITVKKGVPIMIFVVSEIMF